MELPKNNDDSTPRGFSDVMLSKNTLSPHRLQGFKEASSQLTFSGKQVFHTLKEKIRTCGSQIECPIHASPVTVPWFTCWRRSHCQSQRQFLPSATLTHGLSFQNKPCEAGQQCWLHKRRAWKILSSSHHSQHMAKDGSTWRLLYRCKIQLETEHQNIPQSFLSPLSGVPSSCVPNVCPRK